MELLATDYSGYGTTEKSQPFVCSERQAVVGLSLIAAILDNPQTWVGDSSGLEQIRSDLEQLTEMLIDAVP